MGAHLDSWDLAVGAVDNGSGSMAVLDLARALAEQVERTGERPRRTLRFALWMGEELGLYGSRTYVEAAAADGTLERHVATLNLDVVGAPVGLGAMGRPEGDAFLAAVGGPSWKRASRSRRRSPTAGESTRTISPSSWRGSRWCRSGAGSAPRPPGCRTRLRT